MSSGRLFMAVDEGVYCYKFVGDVRLSQGFVAAQHFALMLDDASCQSVLIDVTRAISLDSTTLGVLAELSLASQQKLNRKPMLIVAPGDVLTVLHTVGFEEEFYFCQPEQFEHPTEALEELQALTAISEDERRKRVINAHRTLMALNPANESAFVDLVNALEAEDQERSQSANHWPQVQNQ